MTSQTLRRKETRILDILFSFAQEREDVILYHLLKEIGGANIRWIDIGANDPVEISVTKLFSSMGGKGINVEPQKEFFELLEKDRPYDKNLNVGVGDENGEMLLRGEGPGATFDPEINVEHQEKTIKVPVVTLAQICEDYISKNEEIHFLKIDVEGWEKKVLMGMDFKRFRPWIVCMEAAIPSTDIPSYDEWEYILHANGYSLIGAETINRYYVADEKKDLVNPYLSISDICKKYVIVDYATYEHDTAIMSTFLFRAMRRVYSIFNR